MQVSVRAWTSSWKLKLLTGQELKKGFMRNLALVIDVATESGVLIQGLEPRKIENIAKRLVIESLSAS